jgi:23S rRNA (adenine2503-C2)-methyltransferase
LNFIFDPSIWECTISVICERSESVAAANARQEQLAYDFSQKMLAKGFGVRTFNPAGQDDIGGGCGMLWYVQKWMREHPEKAMPSVGFGMNKVHTPT